MTRRTPVLRGLTLLLAVMQLASPAMSAIADARIAARAGEPIAHVESTSATGCPVLHSADCVVCRYLSSAASIPASDLDLTVDIRAIEQRIGHQRQASRVIVFLPDGRAPPAA